MANLNSLTTHGNYDLEKYLREMIMASGPAFVPGNIYVVFNTSDEAYVQYAKDWDRVYDDGTQLIQTSLSAAYDATTSNRHDVIILNAHNGHALTTMLTVSGNRTHFYGMGMREGGFGVGARARVTMGNSTTSADIGLLKVTGVGNTFDNIKFDSSSTVAASIYCVVDGGEYTIFRNCEIYKTGDKATTGAADLVANGDSSQFIRCWIGSGDVANSPTTAVIRANILFTGDLAATGKRCRDNIFDECVIIKAAGNSANRMVYGAAADAVNRLVWFKGCLFFNNPGSGASCAVAIDFGAAQTQGAVLVDQNCSSVDVTVVGATGEGVYVLSPSSPTYATAGVAVNA